MKVSSTLNLRKFNTVILFVLLLFITCLDSISDNILFNLFFKHVDELITIILLCYILCNYKTAFIKKSFVLCIAFGFLLIGFISSCIYHYQSVVPMLIDAFLLTSRFFIGYLAVIIYASKKNKNISEGLTKIVKIITLILFLLALHDLVLSPFFPKSDYRYFMYGLQLMFPHATYLASSAAVLLIYLGYKNENGQNLKYMLMATFVGAATLRGKALGFFAVYWFVYIIIKYVKSKNYYFTYFLGIIGTAFIARDQLTAYFGSIDVYSPRLILFKDGLKLMLSHFPFGTGYATFGSSIAVNYYSPLYVALKYPYNWGMSPSYSAFLSDLFWPTIFSQFGILGLILFLFIIIYFLKLSMRKMRLNKNAGFAMLMTIVYLLITSIAESSFFNPTALLFFMLFAVYEKEM